MLPFCSGLFAITSCSHEKTHQSLPASQLSMLLFQSGEALERGYGKLILKVPLSICVDLCVELCVDLVKLGLPKILHFRMDIQRLT